MVARPSTSISSEAMKLTPDRGRFEVAFEDEEEGAGGVGGIEV